MLTESIYHLFAERCSLVSPQARKSGSQHGAHNRILKRLRERKRALKKEFKEAKKRNAPKEVIADLAKQYHVCVRMHSKSTHERRQRDEKRTANTIRSECTRNFWKFSSRLLEEETDLNDVQPTCSVEEAHAFFTAAYASENRTFSRPEWMPPAPEPQHGFQMDEIQEEELRRALRRARSGSSPSPKYQVPYRVLKRCPAIITPLLHIFNLCWSTGKIPQQWKQAVIRLIPKPTAKNNPQDLSCFRLIALTSCIGKLYTSILEHRLMRFMNSNKYIDSETQKAFIGGVPGCTEHQYKLWQAILDARRNQRNITVCWLDLANAFGSIHQNLITYALWHYHLPGHFIRTIQSLYSGLTAVISSKEWETRPVHLAKGLFQRDPLSSAIFNVINLYLDTIASECSHNGYRFSSSHHQMPILQYADDTCLTASSKANCQTMLCTTE